MADLIINILSCVGSLASITGIVITYRQVKKVRSVAEATKEATEKTQEEVSKTLSIVQVAKYCESISIIQQAITDNEIKLALYLCHELKAALYELQTHLQKYCEANGLCDFKKHIQSLGINVTNMTRSLTEGKDKLRRTKIIQDLENLHNQLSALQADYKAQNIG